jgi:hypothetical protein
MSAGRRQAASYRMTIFDKCEKAPKREAIQRWLIEYLVCCGMRFVGLFACLVITACSGEIYLRDGVTDGDTFYLAERALTDDEPALQSWVGYSLARSTCQLRIGGDNPARENSFACEFSARRLLLDNWADKRTLDPTLVNNYLDELTLIRDAGFLDEYVARHFRRSHWQLPGESNVREYRRWQRTNLPAHHPETHIIGSWNYAGNVGPK